MDRRSFLAGAAGLLASTGMPALVRAEATIANALPLPAPNVNRTATSLSELYAIVGDFEANFSAARKKYGVPSGEPVIGLDVRTAEKLSLAKRRLPERITIRGVGKLSRNDFYPSSTTQVGDWSLRSARNIRLMAIQFNAQSNGGTGNFIGATDCVLSRNVFNMKAATAIHGLRQNNEVRNGIYFYNSTGCTFSENAVVGANFQLINGQQKDTDGTRTNGLTIAWNVFDQVRGDHIRLQGGSATNWYIHKNLFGGRFRNPGGDHSDCLQVGARQRTHFTNSFFEYNCCFVRESYGKDNHAPVQMWWFGAGSGSADGHTFQQNGHFAPGRLINNKVPRQGVTLARSVAVHNTDMAPSDIPQSYSKGFYSADFACFVYAGRTDYNLVSRKTRKSDRGAGPNGLNIECPRSDDSNNAPRGAWAPQTRYLSCELQRTVTIGCLKPPAPQVRSHWANPRPVGAHLLMQDMFEPSRPNHWKSRGWPIDAMTHIAYDPFNELAGARGVYKAYDAMTGVNLG